MDAMGEGCGNTKRIEPDRTDERQSDELRKRSREWNVNMILCLLVLEWSCELPSTDLPVRLLPSPLSLSLLVVDRV